MTRRAARRLASAVIILAVTTANLPLLAVARSGEHPGSTGNVTAWASSDISYKLTSLATVPGSSFASASKDECPPCFNCLLPAFTCGQYGLCNDYDGQCKCPAGWGGIDCLTPQCDSLADGDQRRLLQPGERCDCKEDWTGLNCNVCQNDNACKNFPLPGGNSSIPDDGDGPIDMTCYKGGIPVYDMHTMCDVTNPGILMMLPDKPPQVTFSCDTRDETCRFQFWVNYVESFYCGLNSCSTTQKQTFEANTTITTCEKIQCSCIRDRFLCGEDGSIDLGEILETTIKGPATMTCKDKKGCLFEEPGMNDLIDSVFGDNFISLTCEGGECLHVSQVPGYTKPPKPDHTKMVALSAAGAIAAVLIISLLLWYAGRDYTHGVGDIHLPEDEALKLMNDHVPATLHFSNISYTLGSRTIIENITGSVKPGQVLAIMGASGAGKTTFLDILARRRKRGVVGGTILVNGRTVFDHEFKRFAGFVDQEDTLMSTLTVYETVLYSALLRLPREMSLAAKRYRTLETMNELGILGIRDMRIGDSSSRGISGGEKRRVSIACELVTSPSILFLDEPTSGLDAYNAFNVVDSLVSLARNYNRTVVFTIHQPRSNIVALFDNLLLMARGKMVYSGAVSRSHEFLASVDKPCPPGFNLADYLIDLTIEAELDRSSQEGTPPDGISVDDRSNLADEERGLTSRVSRTLRTNGHSPAGSSDAVDETEMRTRKPASSTTESSYVKRKTSQLIKVVVGEQPADTPLSQKLSALVDAYAASDMAVSIREEIDAVSRGEDPAQTLPDVEEENKLLRGRRGASWPTQFRILSGRAFKNMYRDPALLAAHYLLSIGLALICGFLFKNVTNDIPGFQNRLGVFFFTLALFGFSCLSSLGLFANERLLYIRERANGYYSSFTYFSSKILFDILPLRVVPPLVFGAIVYRMVGLVPEVGTFWKFLMVLVLFNLATAGAVLLISVTFADIGVASLVGTLVMLFNLLFTGLLINRNALGSFEWLTTISFFHAAYEALLVNEVRYLQLKEHKYGVEIEVPAATILNLFGFRAQSFWWPNVALLGIFFGGFTALTWVMLHFYVREKR